MCALKAPLFVASFYPKSVFSVVRTVSPDSLVGPKNGLLAVLGLCEPAGEAGVAQSFLKKDSLT